MVEREGLNSYKKLKASAAGKQFSVADVFYFPYFPKSSLASWFISSTFFSFIVERIVT